MKKSLFLFILLISVLGFSQNEKNTTPKITIKIALGETITIEDRQLKFVKVLEDSRCPKGVTCIWAGRAKVQVEVWKNDEDSVLKELIFGKVNQGESKELTLFTSEENIVKGYALIPYPSSEKPSDEREYVLLILDEKR
jgi:hypothetical protein